MMESRILGDYTVIKQIGQGSLGTVFLAEHRFMKKQYILKVLPEELSSDRTFIQKFEEDVSILAALDHPHIVKIHNISFSQGQYFLVTDCVVDELGETTNLAQYVIARGKRLPEEEIYRLLMQIADALDYAHSKKVGNKGIVHRGIKLTNILTGKGEGGTHLYLSDFGLSRIIGTGAVLTRTFKNVAEALGIGSTIATPKNGPDRYPTPPTDYQKLIPLHASFLQNYVFLSPEQKRLDHPKSIDAKTDAYAFGVLAYYLLMNEFPEGYFEMPSMKHEYEWDWDSLIRQCLNRDPTQRPDFLLPAMEAIRQKPKFPVKIPESSDKNEETKINKQADEFSYAKPPYINEEFIPANLNVSIAPKHEPLDIQENLEAAYSQKIVGREDSSQGVALKPIIHVTQLERPQADPDPASVFQIDHTVKHYEPERKEIRNVNPLLTDMVVITGGTFMRGSKDGNRDEMPKHQVTLSSFAIDIHPVTNEQFVRFLEAMGGEKDSNHHDIIRMRDSRIKRSGGKLSIESGYAKHPVVGVTWYGAVAYAKWIGKRLLTEAEWEVAARGGIEHALFPTGDDIEKTQANFFSSDTTAVMSYAPNDYGLYDMAGNVYEWCYDWYGYNYYEVSVQEPENPKGPLQGVYRVLRGGCWKSLKEDLRCSRRHRNNPGTVNGTYGFRCAADVQ